MSGSRPADAEVRAAYRSALRGTHPDIVGPSGAEATRLLIEAYEAWQRGAADEPDAGPESDASPEPDASPDPEPQLAARLSSDTLVVERPADEAFVLVLEAAHIVGDVTYIDRSGALIETLVRSDSGHHYSAVLSFQGRGNGTTEAFVTVEPIDAHAPSLPVDLVTDAFLAVLG